MDYEQVITRAAAFGRGIDVSDTDTDADTDCRADNDARADADAADSDVDANTSARWRLISELHAATGRDAFEAVLAAAGSSERERRLVGLDALGQIGYAANRPYLEETLPALLYSADDADADAEVIASAVTALGHVGDPRALPAVLRRVGHADAAVRFAAAFTLPSLTDPQQPEPDVVSALITLTRDADPEVRDWATFGLGTQLDADTPDIREALAARLDDTDDHAAEEAATGLARRGDARALGEQVGEEVE